MDLQKFLEASLSAREATIQVPELASFFAEGETPEWTVRGLQAKESARAEEVVKAIQAGKVESFIKAFAGDGDKTEAIRQMTGLAESEVPTDVTRRIEMLTIGSVSPELGSSKRDVAVRLAETFPATFFTLTNKIAELTGLGSEVGKPKRSGKAEKSEQ